MMRKMRASILIMMMIAVFAMTLTAVSAQTYDEPSPGGGLGGALCFFYACGTFVPFIVLIIAAFLVYNDANKIGVDNPLLWGLVAFFGSLAGILVYVLVIRPKALEDQQKKGSGSSYIAKKEGSCSHCGKYVGASVGRCPYCGSDL
jgi:hypothetical protein